MKQYIQTHETFINQVRELVIGFQNDEQLIEKLEHVKLCYGGTAHNVRGTTIYDQWDNSKGKVEMVVLNPRCESSWSQLAGTTVHELGHVMAGHGCGHNAEWKASCVLLGLQNVKASGQEYNSEDFNPAFWLKLLMIPKPTDGKPLNGANGGSGGGLPVPCSHGIGSRGGKSRGKNSGSRMKKYTCECEKPVIVRHAGNRFNATCNECSALFIKIVEN